MANWNFNVQEYTETSFSIIPAGDHRVRISDVEEKVSKAQNEMYEITLEVSGHSSRLWYYLVLDRNDTKKTNQRIGEFFDSFGINDHNLGSGKQWIGKVGAVRVRHEEYNGNTQAKVAFVINRKNQDKLPPASFSNAAPAGGFRAVVDASDLPF